MTERETNIRSVLFLVIGILLLLSLVICIYIVSSESDLIKTQAEVLEVKKDADGTGKNEIRVSYEVDGQPYQYNFYYKDEIEVGNFIDVYYHQKNNTSVTTFKTPKIIFVCPLIGLGLCILGIFELFKKDEEKEEEFNTSVIGVVGNTQQLKIVTNDTPVQEYVKTPEEEIETQVKIIKKENDVVPIIETSSFKVEADDLPLVKEEKTNVIESKEEVSISIKDEKQTEIPKATVSTGASTPSALISELEEATKQEESKVADIIQNVNEENTKVDDVKEEVVEDNGNDDTSLENVETKEQNSDSKVEAEKEEIVKEKNVEVNEDESSEDNKEGSIDEVKAENQENKKITDLNADKEVEDNVTDVSVVEIKDVEKKSDDSEDKSVEKTDEKAVAKNSDKENKAEKEITEKASNKKGQKDEKNVKSDESPDLPKESSPVEEAVVKKVQENISKEQNNDKKNDLGEDDIKKVIKDVLKEVIQEVNISKEPVKPVVQKRVLPNYYYISGTSLIYEEPGKEAKEISLKTIKSVVRTVNSADKVVKLIVSTDEVKCVLTNMKNIDLEQIANLLHNKMRTIDENFEEIIEHKEY